LLEAISGVIASQHHFWTSFEWPSNANCGTRQ